MMIKCEASEKSDDVMVLCQVEGRSLLAALGWLAGCLGLALGWLAALGWLDSTRLHSTVFNSAWYKYC